MKLKFGDARLLGALCAILPTAIFSLRWRNCLPFSGRMPELLTHDHLSVWGIYTLYAREPFGLPLGAVNGLSFPFNGQNEMLSRGSMPIFAIVFKWLSGLHASFDGFYYLILAEILAVFLAGYLTCRILSCFKVTSLWSWLVGATLVGLSPVFLYRSSYFYDFSLLALYPVVFVMFGYGVLRVSSLPSRLSSVVLATSFLLAGLLHYYLLFALYVSGAILVLMLAAAYLQDRTDEAWLPLKCGFSGVVGGGLGAMLALAVLGNRGTLQLPNAVSAWSSRYATEWGYGGGFGGGFHAADLLSPLIPPETHPDAPSWLLGGPTALLAKIPFPVTTLDLAPGQYEGFAYVGSVVLAIGVGALIYRLLKGRPARPGLRIRNTVRRPRSLAFATLCLAVASSVLFSLSWGYILHIAGHRVPVVPTPSVYLASVYPPFMLARALGRLAIPISLFITFAAVIRLDRILVASRVPRILPIAISVLAVVGHVTEIHGYLKPPERTYEGNQIASVLSPADAARAKQFAAGSNALLLVPDLREGFTWGLIGYSLGYHTGIPLSGRTVTFGEPPDQLRVFSADVGQISAGDLSGIRKKYGQVVVAAPSQDAAGIAERSDHPTTRLDLTSVGVSLLRVSDI